MRGEAEVFKGKINSLKRFKDDAAKSTNGMECGIGLRRLRRSKGRRLDRSLLDRENWPPTLRLTPQRPKARGELHCAGSFASLQRTALFCRY